MVSEETRKNMSKAKLGKKVPNYPENRKSRALYSRETVMELYYGQGLSLRETAKILGVTINALQSFGKHHNLKFRANATANAIMALKRKKLHPEISGWRMQDWADKVKERDGNKCQSCGSGEKLEAHHVFAISKSPELRYDVSNGITSCNSCHKLTATYGNYKWAPRPCERAVEKPLKLQEHPTEETQGQSATKPERGGSETIIGESLNHRDYGIVQTI